MQLRKTRAELIYAIYVAWTKMPKCKECGKPLYAAFNFECDHIKSELFKQMFEDGICK